jgi:uncharacterized protein YfdQ (DUF2303 family)
MSWERDILLKEICREAGTTDQIKLMNWLQDRGLVSDNCEKLEEVPTTDLLRAKNKITARKPKIETT